MKGAGEEALQKWGRETPDLTLKALCQRYQATFDQTDQQVGDRPEAQAPWPYAKKKTFQDPRRQTERVQKRWAEYQEKVSAYEPAQRIYLDERGAPLNLVLEYGRAPQGQRVHSERPTSQGERISTLGALSTQGIITALCFEGTLNGTVFLYFLEHFLCPQLKPGQVSDYG